MAGKGTTHLRKLLKYNIDAQHNGILLVSKWRIPILNYNFYIDGIQRFITGIFHCTIVLNIIKAQQYH